MDCRIQLLQQRLSTNFLFMNHVQLVDAKIFLCCTFLWTTYKELLPETIRANNFAITNV